MSNQAALKNVLEARVNALRYKLIVNLLVTGGLAALSIFLAFLTYRHIVRPLMKLQAVSEQVGATADYSRRISPLPG